MNVRFFARARDLVGAASIPVEMPPGTTVADLRRRLAASVPALAPLLERSAVAVNDDFAEDTMVLPPDADVAVLPPVSGG
jgi:molybdopterin converting factor subunit 1